MHKDLDKLAVSSVYRGRRLYASLRVPPSRPGPGLCVRSARGFINPTSSRCFVTKDKLVRRIRNLCDLCVRLTNRPVQSVRTNAAGGVKLGLFEMGKPPAVVLKENLKIQMLYPHVKAK